MIVYKATPQNFYHNYISHHGIKGQEWGVQNGPPYPLNPKNYSRKEQKSNFKKLKKSENNEQAFEKATREIIDTSGVLKSEEMKSHLKKMRSLKDDFEKTDKGEEFFQGNKYFDAMEKESHDQTYKWFEKNNPEHLKEVIAYNKGSKKNLDYVDHDFRKMKEGYEDQNWTKYEALWQKSPEGKAFQKADKIFDKYYSELQGTGKVISDYLLGKYGNKSSKYFEESFGDKTAHNVDNILHTVINEMGDKKIKKK